MSHHFRISYWLVIVALLAICEEDSAALAAKVAYPHLEASFALAEVAGNPFDFTENDVKVAFARPDGGRLVVPAFFDGGTTWRVRFTPDMPGHYTIGEIALNGRAVEAKNVEPRTFDVSGTPMPGFVRMDSSGKRFVFDNGEPYYPMGCDVGWGDRKMNVPKYLTRLGQAGINWSRIWMTHFDGGDLIWAVKKPGELSLDAVRKWDANVETAERLGIYFQMALQHHGQYSSSTDSNWRRHPWNKANGGWLSSAAEFFTDPQAIALTKAKYRYIVARWGYSPAVMAWELFNEVQYVDAVRSQPKAVTRWHSEMATFLRQQDSYHHLVTTSSDLNLDIWRDMDYYQVHTYPADLLAGIAAKASLKVDKPIFIGEMGPPPHGSIGLHNDDGRVLHPVLWAGMMSPMAGAAQYWEWDTVEKFNLYSHIRAASRFLKASHMAAAAEMQTVQAAVETSERATLRFAPIAGWAVGNNRAEVTVEPNGDVLGIEQMQEMLHGTNHREFPSTYTFHVDYPKPDTFTVGFGYVSKNGASLTLSVDGVAAARHDFPRTSRETHTDTTLKAQVPAGKHTVALTNSGADWVLIDSIEIPAYSPALGVVGKSNGQYAVAWVYRRTGSPEPLTGALVVPGLAAGDYIATWWDTYEGKPLSETRISVKEGQPLRLSTPPIARDAAVWITQ